VELQEVRKRTEGTIEDLAALLNQGKVDTLVITGGNPVYSAPADLDWAVTQRKAREVIRLGYYEDETFKVSDLHIAEAHYLESWGDARTTDGTIVAIQPLIEPLFGGVTELEVLARVGGSPLTDPHEIVRDTFKSLHGGNWSENNWKQFLHDGFLKETAVKPVSAQFNAELRAEALKAASTQAAPSAQNLEVAFHRDHSMDDGRFNNNGWMQEMPDPVTKVTWENLLLVSEETAKNLGFSLKDFMYREGEHMTDHDHPRGVPVGSLTLGGKSVTGPIWIQPGMADNVVAIALGYGRAQTGRIGFGAGFNAYSLRASTAPHYALGGKLSTTGGYAPISCVQHHWAMQGRAVVREANYTQYQENPEFPKSLSLEEPPVVASIYPNPLDVPKSDPRVVHQWGMSIDLNACVSCQACVIACQSENNIPIVGKQQVYRQREMHWMRLDRYYTGTISDPQVTYQPMLCQHCEAAPCENVCPVNATTHDEEGLNVMVYNRCVGTRYCSNNCPYKVRRFNFFDYNRRTLEDLKGPFYTTPLTRKTDGEWDMVKWFNNTDRPWKDEEEWELLKLVKNPDVTVRMRGVMEKCTFCIQRIEGAKIAQLVKAGASDNVAVPDGTIKTACQQVCPADAIVFGNIKDPNSRVSKLKALDRGYFVLDSLYTRPRITYLANVRNPNPKMPDYHEFPLSTQEYVERMHVSGYPYKKEEASGERPGMNAEKTAVHGEAVKGAR
jgi:molybdopterin-containing oxidoreductase family iron-sulfur binding subunit